ncbi:thioredoxin family protein [Tenacibaculum xiamenense]|uniref:thioredoxin family protein n=1 Tax=Tenacibaculum xiamenense TaxID=1261553 RepID=UPI0038943CD5
MKLLKTVFLLTLVTILSSFTTQPPKGYKVGDIAADFSLKNVDGKKVSLADYKEARGFIVIFTCNMCPYSVANEDRIIELDKKFKNKGYPVIAINPNDPAVTPGDSFEGMQKRAKEKGFTFPYLFDEKQEVYPQYGATKTPHVYILNKRNDKLIVEYIGAIDDSSLNEKNVKVPFVENAISSIMKGEKPSQTYTRAIGCSIKTKRKY